MLPSNGYFKHIFCPYDKAKLCHRPYCHYKHAEAGFSEKALGETEETGYLFDPKPTAISYEPPSSGYAEYDVGSCYVPSPTKPVGILKANKNNHSAYYNNVNSQSMVIPEYNPTPISQLKELNGSHPPIQTFKYNAPDYKFPDSRRKKFVEEYDPTTVKYKCSNKKTVMFADQAGNALDDAGPVPNFSSEEEEIDDTATAPKFSDDDLDDDRQTTDRFQAPKPTAKPQSEEDTEEEILDEKNIDEFSLVDKILVSSKKSDKLITNFKKAALIAKPDKTKTSKVSKKTVESGKHKAKSDLNVVYDCDVNEPPKKSAKHISDFDAIMSMASFDDVKGNETENKDDSAPLAKKLKSKKEESSKSKKSSDLPTKDDKSQSVKSKKSSSDKKSKEGSQTSKQSDKSNNSKTKHSSSSDKSNSNSKSSKTEKHKSTSSLSSKTEKSSSSSKSSKSDKDKTSKHSTAEKSSSLNKLSKHNKHLTNSSKSAKEREDKLQDEKVTSSSIAKQNKQDQIAKHLTKSSDAHNEISKSQTKSKSSNSKEDKSKSKMSKRKAEDSDSDTVSEKSKEKLFSSASKKFRKDTTDDDSSSDGGYNDVLSISSESEEDTEEQCKRIFEETYIPNDKSISPDKEETTSTGTTKPTFVDLTSSGKQRLAHAGATTFKKSGPSVPKSNFHPTRNPGQVMLDRFAKIRAAQAEFNETKKTPGLNSPVRGKTRISIAPNHSLLAALAEKNRLNQTSNNFSPLPSTVTKTLKITKRVAHIPDVAVKPRPIIPIDYGSKVPTVSRQKFLNAFIDEYLKLLANEEEAYENALEEEKNAYGRSSSKAIYMNVASNTLNRLRQRVAASTDGTAKKGEVVTSTTNPSSKTVSHETVLNGPLAQRTSFSIERKKAAPTPELKGVALYEHLMTYVLSEEQLKENGYPFPHPTELGKAVIEGIYANRHQYCNDPFKRTCCRCSKIYYVNVDGDYVRDEECDFHWGRAFKRRIAGAIESRYTCCQGDTESDGCCVGTGHVFEGSEAHALKGFVSTLPKTPPPDKYYGIYALDCEMCYTTAGVELTRISVIGPDMKPVYETFVKPQNKVLDFNTRFSGITEENLKNVRTTIRDVQAVLLCMFNSKTILIGHSLESDFKALKLFHKTVVDTSVVFPHKLGLPFKRALRNLSSEKLNKIIQNDVGGHDSAEDAVACMELMIYKIKEDLKGNR